MENYVAEHFDAIKEGKHLIKEFNTVPNNREYIRLKASAASGHRLTEINQASLDKFVARMERAKDYGPGSEATIAVHDAADQYVVTTDRLAQELKDFAASSSTERKKLGEMCRNREHKSIEQA